MYIEKNDDAQVYTIWVDKEHIQDYRESAEFQKAISDGKAVGYSICVYLGGDFPLIPTINDILAANTISA